MTSTPATTQATPPGQTEDRDLGLVVRARAGDLDAFGQLVERHMALVTRVAARIVGPDEAEDVAQEAFLRAHHRLDQFRGEAPFRAWLLRIVNSVALNALAKKPAVLLDELNEADELPSMSGDSRMPAESLELAERRQRLRQKLSLLRPQHRAVLVLRDLEGLSYDEIAQATATPLGSVKGRLFRARQELIELLQANTYDWELPQ